MAVGSELSETEPGSAGFLGSAVRKSGCRCCLDAALGSGWESLRGPPGRGGCRHFLGSEQNSGSEDVLERLSSLGCGGFVEGTLSSGCCGLLGSTLTSGSDDVLERSPSPGCKGFLGNVKKSGRGERGRGSWASCV